MRRLIIKNKIKFPIVIKPINEGSSLGVKIAKNFSALCKSIKKLFRKYDQLLCEQFIGGQEIQTKYQTTFQNQQLKLKNRILNV